MEFLEKPKRKIKTTITKYIFAFLLSLISFLLIGTGISEYLRFQRVSPYAVTVRGVISHVDIIEDDEGSDDYKMYMTFLYKGKKYTTHYDTSSRSSTLNRIGEIVSAEINPEKPTELISSIKNRSTVSSLLGVVFLAGFVVLLRIDNRVTYVKTYGLRREAVKKDIQKKLYHRKLWLFLLITGIGWVFFAIYMNEAVPRLFLPAGGILIAAGIYQLSRTIKDASVVRDNAYELKWVSVIRKEEETDSDGDPVYYLVYYNNLRENKHRVSSKVYYGAKIGESICHVYLTNRAKPFLSYYGMDCVEI